VPFVNLEELSLGRLLAEGGEGRVFEASWVGSEREPLVYKQLREPRPLGEVEGVVRFPSCLPPSLAARLRSSSAWPVAVVLGTSRNLALGTLMPRAPSRFCARHRDGQLRLATLSYLATDPDRIAVAYGVAVPAPGSAERVALVYALCRLLEALEGPPGGPSAAHGDLSAKNTLWSFEPAPAVFLLDCDGARVLGELGQPGDGPRATTPNWYDPAGPAGAGRREADRYALGLAFLRVVGAANFPLQARQRAGGTVSVDLELPRSWRRLPDLPGLWGLCERSLSCLDPASRPRPGEWASQLEQLLGLLGRAELADAVRAGQEGPLVVAGAGAIRGPAGRVGRAGTVGRTVAMGPALTMGPAVAVGDVSVRPLLRERAVSTWQLIRATPGGGEGSLAGAAPLELLRQIARGWARAHSLAIGLLRARGRRHHGARRLVGVLALDLAAACVALFVVGMVVSPWIGL
jgi:hypothetical protein